jgi:hypothetical protein
MKLRTTIAPGSVDAVERDHMQVHIEIDVAAKPLDKRDGPHCASSRSVGPTRRIAPVLRFAFLIPAGPRVDAVAPRPPSKPPKHGGRRSRRQDPTALHRRRGDNAKRTGAKAPTVAQAPRERPDPPDVPPYRPCGGRNNWGRRPVFCREKGLPYRDRTRRSARG